MIQNKSTKTNKNTRMSKAMTTLDMLPLSFLRAWKMNNAAGVVATGATYSSISLIPFSSS